MPHTQLSASGEDVGLPENQFGTEVGHLNIGAGRIVWQALSRITKDIRRCFFTNPALLDTVQEAKSVDIFTLWVYFLTEASILISIIFTRYST